MGRLGGGGQELVRTGERQPVGAHLPAGQRVPRRPLDGVVAVLPLPPTLVHEPVVLPLGLVAAAFVLGHGDVPAGREVLGGGTGAGALVVGSALEHDRERARPLAAGEVDVGREARSVAHRDHHLLAGPVLGGAECREEQDTGGRGYQPVRKTGHCNLPRWKSVGGFNLPTALAAVPNGAGGLPAAPEEPGPRAVRPAVSGPRFPTGRSDPRRRGSGSGFRSRSA